jgi:hypothetical protein
MRLMQSGRASARLTSALAAAASGLCVLAALLIPAMPANAASGPTPPAASRPDAVHPDYSQKITLHTQCGYWSGELEWGGNGSILVPAYIRIDDGELTARCARGWVRLWIHWDTIDNPQSHVVKAVKAPGRAKTPFETDDHFLTYKDIYVWLETKLPDGRVIESKRAGPGA